MDENPYRAPQGIPVSKTRRWSEWDEEDENLPPRWFRNLYWGLFYGSIAGVLLWHFIAALIGAV